MTYNELISFIQQNIFDNNQKLINAKRVRDPLIEIVNYIRENAIEVNDNLSSSGEYTYSINKIRSLISAFSSSSFGGSASPGDTPDTSSPIWYIATQPGKYSQFGNINVGEDELFVVLSYDGSSWTKQVVDLAPGLIPDWKEGEDVPMSFVRYDQGSIYKSIGKTIQGSERPQKSDNWTNMINNSFSWIKESEIPWTINERIDENNNTQTTTTTKRSNYILIPENANSVNIPMMFTAQSVSAIAFVDDSLSFISSFYMVTGDNGVRMMDIPIPEKSRYFRATYWGDDQTERRSGIDFNVSFNFDIQKTVQENSFHIENILPTGSNFSDEFQVNSDGVGLFRPRFGHEIAEAKNGYVHLDIDSSQNANSGFWIQNKLPHTVRAKGAIYEVSGYIKYDSGSDTLKTAFYFSRTPHISSGDPSNTEWQYFRSMFHQVEDFGPYDDNRIFLFSPGHTKCYLKSLSVRVLQETEIKNYWETISLENINTHRLPRLNKAFINNDVINIGLFGDSWTQGVDAPNLKTYSKYTARLLWEKYGYAGLGWFDFGHSNNTDMLCVDDEAVTFTESNVKSIVNRDPSSLGMTISHRVMSANTSYAVEFIDEEKKVDNINILSYQSSEYRYRINEGSWVSVSNGSGQNIYSEVVSDSEISKIEFESLKDNSIIFGMDLSYGNKGIKIHKIGNRGLTTQEVLDVNRDVYKDEMNYLNLDFISVCLLTNDRTNEVDPRQVRTNIYEILKIFSELEGNVSRLILCPTDTKRIRDIQVQEYNYYLKKLAIENKIALLDLSNVLGTQQDIEQLELMDDEVHPNHIGSQMLADYIVKSIFNYEKLQ